MAGKRRKQQPPQQQKPQHRVALDADDDSVVSKKISRHSKQHQKGDKMISSDLSSKILKEVINQQKEILQEEEAELNTAPFSQAADSDSEGKSGDEGYDFDGFSETEEFNQEDQPTPVDIVSNKIKDKDAQASSVALLREKTIENNSFSLGQKQERAATNVQWDLKKIHSSDLFHLNNNGERQTECPSDRESSNRKDVRRDAHKFYNLGKMSKSLSGFFKRGATRNPRWTKEHNAIFGEILMEHFLLENIPNDIPKDMWEAMTITLNRRLNTTYSINVVVTQFKNMKSDFKNIYQSSNKSGWGRDYENNLPVTNNEIWDELIQEDLTMAHYRRNSFLQYDLFEKMCGDIIATENLARATHHIGTPLQCQPDEPLGEDNVSVTQEHIGSGVGSIHVNPQPTSSKLISGNEIDDSGSKRTITDEPSGGCSRANISKEDIQMLVDATNERTRMFEREFQRQLPFTMSDCMSKLDSIPQLSNEGMLSLLDVLKSNTEKKVIFMMLTGDRLHAWIEHIHAGNPDYHSCSTWLPVNDNV